MANILQKTGRLNDLERLFLKTNIALIADQLPPEATESLWEVVHKPNNECFEL